MYYNPYFAERHKNMHYDFDNFLNSIKYLDRADVLVLVQNHGQSLEKASTRYDKQERLELQKNTADLLFWMEHQKRPLHMNELEFAKFKPLCENFIKKHQLASRAMELFSRIPA